jgi:small subunit ribosomal protein S17
MSTRKRQIGTVTSDKNAKTRRVVVERRYRHPVYGKIVRGRTVCHVHDEENASHAGDVVEIVESRPRSALKRWELVRVVKAAGAGPGAATATAGEGTGAT